MTYKTHSEVSTAVRDGKINCTEALIWLDLIESKYKAQSSTIPSGIAGGHINAQTGKPVKDDGKALDSNGWRKE